MENRLRRLRNCESSEAKSFIRMKLRPVCMKGLLMSTAVSRLAVRVRGATAMSASCTHTDRNTQRGFVGTLYVIKANFFINRCRFKSNVSMKKAHLHIFRQDEQKLYIKI